MSEFEVGSVREIKVTVTVGRTRVFGEVVGWITIDGMRGDQTFDVDEAVAMSALLSSAHKLLTLHTAREAVPE